MNYLDKYYGQNGRKSVLDILRLNPNTPSDWQEIHDNYKATDIDKVKIDGDTFTNYGDFQFIWEKSYVKSPSRSASGAIDNLDSYATFVTPHLILNFSIMSIDDYRAIMQKIMSKNEFTVECYDPIFNDYITAKMYFGTPQMAKLYTIAKTRFNGDKWEEFVELVGVEGYTVELIGTNTDPEEESVTYHLNPPIDTNASPASIVVEGLYRGQDVIIGKSADSFTNETFGGKYVFSKWNILPGGGIQGNFINNSPYTINYSLNLYAQWSKT